MSSRYVLKISICTVRASLVFERVGAFISYEKMVRLMEPVIELQVDFSIVVT